MASRARVARSLLSTPFFSSKSRSFGHGPGSGRVRGDGAHVGSFGSSVSFFSSAAAAVAAEPVEETHVDTAASPVETRLFGMLKEYEDYRRALYGGLTHNALLVDAVGTLVVPSQPMAQVSAHFSVQCVSVPARDFVLGHFYLYSFIWSYLHVYAGQRACDEF